MQVHSLACPPAVPAIKIQKAIGEYDRPNDSLTAQFATVHFAVIAARLLPIIVDVIVASRANECSILNVGIIDGTVIAQLSATITKARIIFYLQGN